MRFRYKLLLFILLIAAVVLLAGCTPEQIRVEQTYADAKVGQSEAAKTNAEANIEKAEADKISAQAEIEQAKAAQVAAQAQVEQARASQMMAQAQVEQARADRTRADTPLVIGLVGLLAVLLLAGAALLIGALRRPIVAQQEPRAPLSRYSWNELPPAEEWPEQRARRRALGAGKREIVVSKQNGRWQ